MIAKKPAHKFQSDDEAWLMEVTPKGLRARAAPVRDSTKRSVEVWVRPPGEEDRTTVYNGTWQWKSHDKNGVGPQVLPIDHEIVEYMEQHPEGYVIRPEDRRATEYLFPKNEVRNEMTVELREESDFDEDQSYEEETDMDEGFALDQQEEFEYDNDYDLLEDEEYEYDANYKSRHHNNYEY